MTTKSSTPRTRARAATSERWTVGALMTAQPLTIGREQSLSTAHRLMRDNGVRHLPVLEHGELIGVVSQRDLYFLETIRGVELDDDLVEDAMTTDTYAVEPDAPIGAVAKHMARYRYGCAVVLERGKVAGIFTATDALRLVSTLTTAASPARPADASTTRLHVRARAAFPSGGRLHVEWMRPAHHLMQQAQLRHLAARVEHRLSPDDARDVAEGIGGAAVMLAAFVTPFLREARSHWGVDAGVAARVLPGDALVAAPRWSWTHGIEIDAPPDEVWPWIAQLGADRGGFYSYQWLENVSGCELRNAESIHPKWALSEGDALVLHPKMPPLRVVALERGHHFVVHAPADAAARAAGKPWADASWLFLVEPVGEGRSRLISRYRCATSDDLVSRLGFGPMLLEPIGFAMDRRMLLGVKPRVEARRTKAPLRSFARRGRTARGAAGLARK